MSIVSKLAGIIAIIFVNVLLPAQDKVQLPCADEVFGKQPQIKASVEASAKWITHKVLPMSDPDVHIANAKVTIEVVVDQNGSVQCTRLIKGHPMLISSCLLAASQWKFKPHSMDDKLMPFLTTIEFQFTNGKISAR